MFGSGTTILISSNEEMDDIMKITPARSLVVSDMHSKAKGFQFESAYCNHRHSILWIFDTLPNFLLITSETKGDY